MKYSVKIDDQTYNVQIVDLHTRPIHVLVDGESFEVWPEGETYTSPKQASSPAVDAAPPQKAAVNLASPQQPHANGDPTHIRAPIPGVILSVAVHPGEAVKAGQVLCVLEAMKMKNLIRAAREGVIAQVHVLPGQTVQHSDLLMEFELQETAK